MIGNTKYLMGKLNSMHLLTQLSIRTDTILLGPVYAILLILAFSATAFAWDFPEDHRRKGYKFELGAGLGTLGSTSTGEENLIGLQTDMRIGYATSEKLRFHYTGKQFWYRNDKKFLTFAHPSLGATYYLTPNRRSFYISVGVGASIAFMVSDGMPFIGGATGTSAAVGFGYEFSTQHSIEMHFLLADYQQIDSNVWNLMLTVNVSNGNRNR